MPLRIPLASALVSGLALASAVNGGEPPRPKSWVRLASNPYPVNQADIAYDAARDRVVLYGGAGMTCGTWEFDGQAWACTPVNFGLTDPRLVFDETRQRVITFGGQSQLSRTREWTGAAWPIIATTGPSSRSAFGFAWDSARQRAVLFGGFAQTGTSGSMTSTWEWTGNTWVESTAPAPPLREYCAMAYDAARARTVLYGGAMSAQLFSDTWEWDGTSWTRIVAPPPPQRFGTAMEFSPGRGRSLLHAGTVSIPGGFNGETWSWDGATWRLEIEHGPLAQRGAMCYDSTRHRIVMVTVTGDDGTWALPDCPGDANADGVVNMLDLNAVLSGFGNPATLGIPGDLDGNRRVGFSDLNQVLSFFGTNGCD